MYLNNFNKEVVLMMLNCTNVKKTNYINNEIDNKNLYDLETVLKLSIMPPFLQNGMITIVSSDSSIADIEIHDFRTKVRVKGTGSVTFEIKSVYNVNIKTSFTLNVTSAINNFNFYTDLSYTNKIESSETDTIKVIKNDKLSTTIYANISGIFTDYQNEYLDKYSNSS